MFAKQRRDARESTPEVRPFRVGRLLLEDMVKTTERRSRLLFDSYQLLEGILAAQRPNTQLCGQQTLLETAYGNAFLDWEKINPGKTTDDFDLIYDPGWDDDVYDPRLGNMTFMVTENGEGAPAGIFNLYNIQIENETRTRLEVSACPAPAFRTPRGINDVQQVFDIMDHIVETDLPLVGTSQLLAFELRFPTGDDFSWDNDQAGPEVPYWSEVIDLLEAKHVLTKTRVGNRDKPARVRRA